ncbi:hypothetical protein C2S51_011340 [Perilla frutescens var. frutescens]|nr:hypothetical protein C2S51_011340 [Perilla frutescens var. frutescens]
MDANFTDLFLNQEPLDPPSLSIALTNESETAHERVEERIRQLQGVTVRAGQRLRCERNSAEISFISSDNLVNTDVEPEPGFLDEINNMMNAEKGRRGCKRDSSHLVGKALALAMAMDSPARKGDKEGGNFYDCNICLDIANDPVLTCCGHLFCWPCFYQVGYIDSTSKECPVCKGEVSDDNVIPIYGNSGNEVEAETESGLKVPPRPKARRVESVRQPG